MTPGTKWALAIVGLLAANILAMVILAVSAGSHAPRVMPSYEHASPRAGGPR